MGHVLRGRYHQPHHRAGADKRIHVSDNDIPDVVRRFHDLQGEESRSRKEQSFLVSVEDIRANGYNLTINKYKEVERTKEVYDSVETILARLHKSETEYIKGYSELVRMLED